MGGWEAKCWTKLRAAMKKVPVAEKQAEELPKTAEEQIERLVDKADAAGLESEHLDEIVHEFAASVAADVNNGGLEDQIRYLVDGIGVQHTERQIDELIAQRQEEER